MRFGFRSKLIFSLVVLFALSFVASTVVVEKLVRNFWIGQLKKALEASARLLAFELTGPLQTPGYERLDQAADTYGQLLALRVTVIDTTGKVWGDTQVGGDTLVTLENHASRPEVAAALSGKTGSSIRFSTTVKTEMLYLAYPISDGGHVVGVVRLARPLAEVNEAIARIRRTILIFFLVVFATLSIAGAIFFLRQSRPVKQLVGHFERLKAGDFSARVSVTSKDEFLLLGQTVNELAERLEQSFAELKEQKQVQDTTLHTLTEGVLAADGSGRIVFSNPALRTIFHLEGGFIGQPFHTVFRQPGLLAAFDGVLKEGGIQKVTIKETFPTHRVIETYFSSPRETRTVRLVAVFQDITQAYRLEQVRKDFVANASHELRTPLSVVKGYVETLEDGLVSEEERKAVFQTLGRNIERMGLLIGDLLHLSKLESPEFTLNIGRVTLTEVARAALSSLQSKIAAKKQKLTLDLPPDLSLRADRLELEVALKNLLENAIQYTSEGSAITLRAAEQNGTVVVTVADTGIGIPSQELERIFERFYRGDKSRSREEGGTGLGLSIVKHIAEAHGGRVEVESEVGKGSSFTLILPS